MLVLTFQSENTLRKLQQNRNYMPMLSKSKVIRYSGNFKKGYCFIRNKMREKGNSFKNCEAFYWGWVSNPYLKLPVTFERYAVLADIDEHYCVLSDYDEWSDMCCSDKNVDFSSCIIEGHNKTWINDDKRCIQVSFKDLSNKNILGIVPYEELINWVRLQKTSSVSLESIADFIISEGKMLSKMSFSSESDQPFFFDEKLELLGSDNLFDNFKSNFSQFQSFFVSPNFGR